MTPPSSPVELKERYSTRGLQLVSIGAIFILGGLLYGFVPVTTMCPANGCPSPTPIEVLEFYWPGFLLIAIGMLFELLGVTYIMKGRSILIVS